MRYQVKQAANGKYLVIDTTINGFQTVAGGLDERQAKEWAAKLEQRHSEGRPAMSLIVPE